MTETSTSSSNPVIPAYYGPDTGQKTGKKRRREERKFEPHDPICVKNATDLQRIRLERLMKNPDKPVYIPGPSKEPKMRQPREFIRNIWGSSAGVGSGDFHIYRGIRRREYERQKFVLEKAAKEEMDNEFLTQKTARAIEMEERAERRRAKRQRKKAKAARKKHVEARTRRLREQLAVAATADSSASESEQDAKSSTDSEDEDKAEEPKEKAPHAAESSAAPSTIGDNSQADDSDSSSDSFDVPPSTSANASVLPLNEPAATTGGASKNSVSSTS